MTRAIEPVRVWVIGFGTVGGWLLRALHSRAEMLAERYGVTFAVVGLANARDGFIHDPGGLDIPSLLAGRPLDQHPDVRHWSSALEGLRATEADVLVEVTASPSDDG